MTMRIILIKPGQPALIARALDRLIKGLMLERANCMALEDREASTRAVDQAVALKRIIGEIDEDTSATLVLNQGYDFFAGLQETERACTELFGLGCTPEILDDALNAHTATLAVGLAGMMHVGGKMDAVMNAAKALLDEYGGDVPDWLRPAAAEFQRALDAAEACADISTFTQEDMDAAVERAKITAPALAAWIATVRAALESASASAKEPE